MNGPIAIYDSGVGGLSIVAALEALLPHEDILYFADTAHFPYGEKSPVEILRFASQAAAFLFTQNAKMLIIACHSATAAALKNLQKAFPLPILGMLTPTIRALKSSHREKIGILATEATIESGMYQKAISKELPNTILYPLSCPGLAETIQDHDGETQKLIQSYVHPIQGQNVDTLILACTHFCLIQQAIQEELDPCTTILSPAASVAEAARLLLKEPADPEHSPHHTFYASGETESLDYYLKKFAPKSPYTLLERSFE